MKLQIELERPSAVFYAGEVVRGTVRLDCDDLIKCRGFFLRLRGKARVHWHTGSGDNRTDYDGSTLFQDQRQTLFGNFYKTALIDEAGENAYFDRIRYSGTMNIPCDEAEKNNLKMVVRVMDYDFGKRDDLLGEILLDVPRLVQSKKAESFPLTRNGKSGQGEVTLSAFFLPYEAKFPTVSKSGLRVSSVVRKQICLVLRVHQASGLRKADWIGRNDVYIQAYRLLGEQRPGRALPRPETKTIIPSGTLVVPFAFQLPSDAPGSAELGVGDRSYIRYSVRVNVDKAFWTDPSIKRVISVIPNRPLPSMQLLAPYSKDALDQPIYDCKCCGCRCCKLNGTASAKLRLGRLAYAPGEVVDLTESIAENETNQDLRLEILLSQHAVMRTGRNHWMSDKKHYSLLKATIGANKSGRLIDIPGADNVRIPAVFPSFYGGLPGNDATFDYSYYPCLKWSYTIELRIGGGKDDYQSAIYSRVPLLISSASPYSTAVERAQSQSQASSLPNLFDAFDIFNHAIVSPEGCDTAPTITGPEDGGAVVAAQYVGMVSIWEDSEDNNLIQDPQHNSYQPVVNTFPAPTAPFEQKLDTGDLPIVYASYASEADELLAKMENSFDLRLVVGEWVRDHPQAARSLSPDDFRSILSKVTFTWDQQAVVGELVAAFESTQRLTCAHIVAAMEICKYQRADVAKLMARHVADPERKQIVLDMIDLEFERRSVAASFGSAPVM